MPEAQRTTAGLPRMAAVKRIADRISRAFHHRLLLLHRAETSPSSSSFFVLGATGNVYTVTISTTPSCTCPDPTTPCKHILFVLLRIFRLSPFDRRLHRRTLREADVHRILSSADLDDSALAGAKLRYRFRQIFDSKDAATTSTDGATPEEEGEELCPVCLEKLERRWTDNIAVCVACGNGIHVACFEEWRKSRGRRGANCVMCRARWKKRNREGEKYVNLEAFAKE